MSGPKGGPRDRGDRGPEDHQRGRRVVGEARVHLTPGVAGEGPVRLLQAGDELHLPAGPEVQKPQHSLDGSKCPVEAGEIQT